MCVCFCACSIPTYDTMNRFPRASAPPRHIDWWQTASSCSGSWKCPRKLELKYTILLISQFLGPDEVQWKVVSWKHSKNTQSPADAFIFNDQLNFFIQSNHSLQCGYCLQDVKHFSPSHHSEPGLFCIFQKTAVSAFTFVRIQNKAEKNIQWEDITLTVMLVRLNVLICA